MSKKTPKEYRPGQVIRVKLSGGRIEEATIKAVLYFGSTQKLQVDLAMMKPRSSSFGKFLMTRSGA